MAQAVRQFPSTAEKEDFRALEYFFLDVERTLKLVGEVTVTVGSVGAGGIALIVIPVTGARVNKGQTVQVGIPAALSGNFRRWGDVTADDQVTVYLENRTGSPIVLTEHTYAVRVMP